MLVTVHTWERVWKQWRPAFIASTRARCLAARRNVNTYVYHCKTSIIVSMIVSTVDEFGCQVSGVRRSQECAALVPETGLEPVRGCPHRFLRPKRLPFRHSGFA
jgi:hypothetical protein